MKIYIKLALAFLLFSQTACSDFLTGEDSKYVMDDELEDVLERNNDAIILGVYARSIKYAFNRAQHDDFGQKSLDLSVDISAQDMVHSSMTSWFRKNYWIEDRTATTDRPQRQWYYCYANIRDLTDMLSAIPKENLATASTATKHMRGEALALRAYHYFMLVNLFQTGGEWSKIKDLPGVPVYKEVTLAGNPRAKVSEVYDFIFEDYEEAIELLKDVSYTKPTRVGERAVKLLAARAYLYAGNYKRALELSSEVVAGSRLMSTNDYQAGFDDINNVEWLLGIDVTPSNATSYASFFSQMDATSSGYAGKASSAYKCIDAKLYKELSDNDVRKANFKTYNGTELVQHKFIDNSKKFLGDLVYLRSAEAWYIKAESQARLNDVAGAQATLDAITNARVLVDKDGNATHGYTWSGNKEALIDQIFVQKRLELWGEGQNAFEFNRMEKAIDRNYPGTNHPVGNINTGDKVLVWGDAYRILQLPIKEIEGNPNITPNDQNP